MAIAHHVGPKRPRWIRPLEPPQPTMRSSHVDGAIPPEIAAKIHSIGGRPRTLSVRMTRRAFQERRRDQAAM